MPGLDDPADLAWAASIFRAIRRDIEASRSTHPAEGVEPDAGHPPDPWGARQSPNNNRPRGRISEPDHQSLTRRDR